VRNARKYRAASESDRVQFDAETHTPAAAEPQRLKTLANLQRAIAYTVKPRLLQYRAVHHDSERAAETQSACRSAPFINFSGKRHNQSAIASHMRL
jgi:hypothetical protein